MPDTQRFRALLFEEREKLVRSHGTIEDGTTDSRVDAGVDSQDERIGGGAAITLDRELDAALDDNSARLLEAIDDAVRRIDEGIYGTCTRCGEAIPKARLEAVPYAAECMRCQEAV